MKSFIIALLCTWIFFQLSCNIPSDPAEDYSNAIVTYSVDSLKADSSGKFIDTLGDTVNFSFFRKYSQHIDSFVVNFNDGVKVMFATSEYVSDSIHMKHAFASVGRKVVNLTIYYNNKTIRTIDTVAVFDILNRKPEFIGIKPDSVFTVNDSSSIIIPFKVKKWSSDSLVFRIVSSTLPDSSKVFLAGDTMLIVTTPKNTGGSFKVIVQVADRIDSVTTTFNLRIVDKTAPFAPIFTCPSSVATTTPSWTWKTGGNEGAGIYRFNIDNENITASLYAEKATTSFQPPMNMSEGMHTLFLQERDSSGNWSPISSWAITIDVTGPAAPAVTGTTPVNNRRPTWSWTGSNAVEPHFKVQLDQPDFSPTDTSYTLLSSFTPATDLTEGKHTLYVREVDKVGNMSASGSFTIVVDLTGPQPPTVSGTTPTSNTRPVWNWTSNGGGGTGEFRCALDTVSFDSSFFTTAHTYTAPRVLGEGNHTLNVEERDSAGNWSSPGVFTILIDITPPNAPIVSVKSITSNQTPTWTWTTGGGGNGTFRYKLDSDDLSSNATENTLLSFTPPTSLSEGLHTFCIQERDSAGNWSPISSRAITIDVTGPATPVVTGITPVNTRKPTWSWTGSNAVEPHFKVQLDQPDFSSTDTSYTLSSSFTPATDLTEGKHTLYVREIDIAGNWSASGSFTIVIDLAGPQPPTVSGTTPTSNTRPVWNWTSNGGGGTGEFRCALDTVSFDSSFFTTAHMYTAPRELGEGKHTLNVEERDSAGNWSSAGAFTILIDVTPPNAPIVSVKSITSSRTPIWTWTTGGGGNGTFRYKLDSDDLSSNATENTSLSFTPPTDLTEGLHTFYIQERDSTGNWSVQAAKETVIDITPPEKPVISGVSLTNNTKPSWIWTTIGEGPFRVKVDSRDMSTGATALDTNTYTCATALTEGNHLLFVQASDSAGNWSPVDSFLTVIDLTPPPAPVVIGTPISNSPRPTWSWSSSGGSGQFRYKLDASDLSTGAQLTTAATFTPAGDLTEGVHTLYVQESDAAGNWSASGSFATTIDLTAAGSPKVSGESPTNNSKPTWSWKSGGGSKNYRYKLDDTTFTTGATATTDSIFTPTTALAEGIHILYVQESDGAGNWSPRGLFTIQIDLTPPSPPTITGVTPTKNTKPVWSWKIGTGGNGTFRYKFNSSDFTSGATITTDTTYTPATDLAEQAHTLYLQQRDAAGNWSTSVSFTIVVDITAPNAPVVSGVTPTNSLRPVWSWVSGGGGGNGRYRYSLDMAFSIIEIGRPVRILWTTATQYQPTTDLAVGSHTLYVQEQDAAGNISTSGSKTIVIDNTAGNAPVVSGTTPTNNGTPAWSWTSGGGKGYYMYRLDNSSIEGAPTYTTSTTFTPSSALSEGLHVLYVKEQDAAGNWSAAGYFGITVDLTKPSKPTFTSATTSSPASVKTITWQWQAGSGSNGYCRYKLDNGSWSVETNVTSYTALVGDGQHILYVKNRDAAGNWSDSSFKTIDVFLAPTNMKVTLDKAASIVTVTWTDNSTAELGYQLYLTQYSTYNPSQVIRSFQTAVNGTAIQLGASTELCTVIYYHLIAVRADGLSTPALTVGTGCINYP